MNTDRLIQLVESFSFVSDTAGFGQPHRSLYLLTYLLTPWSRVLLEKLTSKLCS